MLLSKATTDLISVELDSLLNSTISECTTGGEVLKASCLRAANDKVTDQAYQHLFLTDEGSKALKSLASASTPRSQKEIEFLHSAVARFIQPFIRSFTETAVNSVEQMQNICTGLLQTEVKPKLHDFITRIVTAEQNRLTTLTNQRIEFLTAELDQNLSMIANREAKLLSPYVAGLVKSLFSMHHRAVTAEAALGIVRDEPNRIVEDPAYAAELERSICEQFRPQVLGKISEERAKQLLLDSYQREKALWAEVDRLTEVICETARNEDQRREAFHKQLEESLAGRTLALEEQASALQRDLASAHTNLSKVTNERDVAYTVAYRLDELVAKLNLQVTALFKEAQRNRALSDDFVKVHAQLQMMEYTSRCKGPLSVPGGWPEGSAPDTKGFLEKLKCRFEEVPPLFTLRDQQGLLSAVIGETDLKSECQALQSQVAALMRRVQDLEKQLVIQRHEGEKNKREVTCRLGAQLDSAHVTARKWKSAAQKSQHAASEATVKHIVCSDPLIDDLTRQIRALQHQAKERQFSVPKKEDVHSPSKVENLTPPPETVAAEKEAQLSSRKTEARRQLVELEEQWLELDVRGAASKPTMRAAPPPIPHSHDRTPRMRQVRAAYAALHGNVVSSRSLLAQQYGPSRPSSAKR